MDIYTPLCAHHITNVEAGSWWKFICFAPRHVCIILTVSSPTDATRISQTPSMMGVISGALEE